MKNMKIRSSILYVLIIISILSIPIVFSNIVEILLEFGTGINIELGSGVNITEGTVIRLTGLNCNLTVVGNHIVDNMVVYPNYLLLNTSLRNLTHILNVPYIYSPENKVLNITCSQPNTETTLTVDISDLNSIKIYEVSEPANLTSVDWSPASQNFSFTVNAPSGISTVKVYWPDSNEPTIKECTSTSCISSWDSATQILTLTAIHSSPVTWTIHAETLVTTTVISTTTTTTPDNEKPQWSNLYRNPPEPTVITTLDPVTINVTWSDNNGLNTVIIWENSTGGWQGHVV
ncbi:MAG: hypothetical protein NTW30_03615 [Candidatus Aenigmarchaeota archaeon]|nr:hypothetical protein [Candidatus Aenigmarchaeota archaeon]